jgi:hypothetical protein
MSSMNKSVRDYNWADVIMVSDSIFLEEKEMEIGARKENTESTQLLSELLLACCSASLSKERREGRFA